VFSLVECGRLKILCGGKGGTSLPRNSGKVDTQIRGVDSSKNEQAKGYLGFANYFGLFLIQNFEAMFTQALDI
jgi:hypothetical protein